MGISGISSGAQQVAQTTQVMNELLKMAVSADQELSGKLVRMSAESKVAAGDTGSRIDAQA